MLIRLVNMKTTGNPNTPPFLLLFKLWENLRGSLRIGTVMLRRWPLGRIIAVWGSLPSWWRSWKTCLSSKYFFVVFHQYRRPICLLDKITPIGLTPKRGDCCEQFTHLSCFGECNNGTRIFIFLVNGDGEENMEYIGTRTTQSMDYT